MVYPCLACALPARRSRLRRSALFGRSGGAALRAAFGGRQRFALPWGAFGAPAGLHTFGAGFRGLRAGLRGLGPTGFNGRLGFEVSRPKPRTPVSKLRSPAPKPRSPTPKFRSPDTKFPKVAQSDPWGDPPWGTWFLQGSAGKVCFLFCFCSCSSYSTVAFGFYAFKTT